MLKLKTIGVVAVAVSMLASSFSGIFAAASTDVTVIQSYDSKTGFTESQKQQKQGADHWYFREFGSGKSTNLTYSGGKNGTAWGWYNEDYSASVRADAMNVSSICDVEMTFKSDFKGVIRIKSSLQQMAWTNYLGDGVDASILKNSTELWSAEAVSGADPTETELIVSVKKGDEINFRLNARAHNAYDAFAWWPVVERIEGEYISDDTATYYQYDEETGEETQLTIDDSYNDGEGGYYAADKVAVMSDSTVMPTNKYSLIKRTTVESNGRYRVNGVMNSADSRGGGNLLTVSKNGVDVWKQLFVSGEDGKYDVRMLAQKGDVIDIKVSAYDFTGYNMCEWESGISKFLGTVDVCDASSVGGVNGATLDGDGTNLGAIATSGSENVKVYSVKWDVPYEMTYDASAKKWTTTVTGDGGYISADKALPGVKADTVLEQTVDKSGTIRFSGNLSVSGNSDGVLAKIYIVKDGGEELLWSSRVGEERSVRWDETYDTCYFVYDVNAVANVNAGDKIKYVFNHWRLVQNEDTTINNLKINYVSEAMLSNTTKWKLAQSVVADMQTCKIYKDGKEQTAQLHRTDDTTYIAKSDAAALGFEASNVATEVIDGVECIPIRAAAEADGKAVNWAADRFVLIYDGIPVMFGYPELSEIKAVTDKGGSLFE